MNTMDYNELYDVLKFNFDQNKDWINIKELNITIEKVPFVSQSAQYLFTSEAHHCDEHQQVFSTRFNPSEKIMYLYNGLIPLST